MAERIVRPARTEDVTRLSVLKSTHVQTLYRGFVPDELICRAEPAYYYNRFEEMLKDTEHQLDVLELDGLIMGYTFYGKDPEAEGFGLIVDAISSFSCETADRDHLIMHSIEQLAMQGYRKVHLWMLRDNFRLRFLIEQFGFKPDGGRKLITYGKEEMQLTRYIFRAPGHDGKLADIK